MRRLRSAVAVATAVFGIVSTPPGAASVRVGAGSMPATATRTSAPDYLAGALQPGQAEVALGLDRGATYWDPALHADLSIVLTARLRGHSRVGSAHRVWVRLQSPRVRCAASYASDSGQIVSDSVIHRTAAGVVGRIDSAGNLVSARISGFRYRRAQTLRFCVWLSAAAGTRIRPVVQDIRVGDRLFGAADAHDGSFGSPTGALITSVATIPFRDAQSTTSPNAMCASGPGVFNANATGNALFFQGSHEHASRWFTADCPGGAVTDTYAPFHGQALGPPLGSLSWTYADQSGSGATILHLGDCDLEAGVGSRTVAEAATYIQAVGCPVGRAISVPAPASLPGFGFRQPPGPPIPDGEVYELAVHGGLAELVPTGTTVDVVVNP